MNRPSTEDANKVEVSIEVTEEGGGVTKNGIDSGGTKPKDDDSDDSQFDRFSNTEKRLYLVIVSVACFLSPISTTMFLPAIPHIAEEFNTNGTTITSSNAVYCVFMAISSCITSPCTRNYGRRLTTVVCTFGYTVSAFIVSQSQNVPMFYVFRACMALFGTPFFSVSATIIADIYSPQQRGKSMAYILIGTQGGLAIAAVIGGIVVHFVKWRVVFLIQGGMGCVVFLLSFFFLKETGVNVSLMNYRQETGKKFKFYAINPIGTITISKHLIVLLGAFMPSTILYGMFALLTPITYVMQDAFSIDSTIIIALFYLAPGGGFLLGATLGGRWSDHIVKSYMKKRGIRIPEDRLRACWYFLAFGLPISILLYGWSLEKQFGGIAFPVVMMVINGFCQCMCLPSLNSYNIDSMPGRVPDAVANSYVFRFLFSAIANGTILPQIEALGIGWTCTITSFILAAGGCSCVVLIMIGGRLRSSNEK